VYCFFFAHISQLVNAGKPLLPSNQTALKALSDRAFPNCKNFQKTAKPIGKAWQTNSATLFNFA
jgi:hypothetical protein